MNKAVIIILNYNDSDTAIALSDKIYSYNCLSAVVIVDNCSPDGSYRKMTEHYSLNEKVDVLCAPSNNGYASGNNFGIKYAEEKYDPKYIFVANPDIDVSEDTIDRLIDIIEHNREYGVIAPIVNEGYNVWNLPGFLGMIESLFLVWFNLDKRRIKNNLLKKDCDVCPVGAVEGSFFLIRREDYDKISGLDERTFLYAEENILARRLLSIGKKVGACPKLLYHHYHSVSIKKAYNYSKRKAFPNFYKSFLIYNKYYLHTTKIQDVIFCVMYKLAYFERFLYDCIKR